MVPYDTPCAIGVKLIMNSTAMLEHFLAEVKETPRNKRKLWIFDFDDTLVMSDSVTHVTAADGRKFDLTPAQFALYERQPGDVFDYSDFKRLINPRPIAWMNAIFRRVYASHGREKVTILSARCVPDPIIEYLDSIQLDDIEVVTVDSGSPILKMAWVIEAIRTRKLEEVVFFDDSPKNAQAIAQIRELYPKVTIKSWHVTQDGASLV